MRHVHSHRFAGLSALIGLVALAVAVATGSPAHGQTPPQRPAAGAPSMAVGPGVISGQVTDGEAQPLAGVAITLRAESDSAIVTGALTRTDGRFRLEGLAPGRYLLRVSMLGYRSRSSEPIAITPGDPAVDLGAIALEPSPIQLDGIEAAVERAAVVVEADRTVYDARSMPVASSGNATDVLRAVPELEVDVNDEVRLRGNQPVAIHLNGRPAPLRGEQLANFLRPLPGDRIDRVEVMPNPSARHDPEGMGGIVNIVLREDADLGLSGSLGVNVSTRNRQNLNGRLNYQRGRLTLFTGGGISTFNQDMTHHDLRRNLVTTPVTLIEQSSASAQQGFGVHSDWTAELRVGKQATLWSNAWLFANSSGNTGTTAYGITDEAGAVLERYDRINDSDFFGGNLHVGLGFRQVFTPQREELTIDGRLSRGGHGNDTHQNRLIHVLNGEAAELPPELLLNEVDSGTGNLSIQADYFRPVGDGRLEVGYRAWRRDQDNTNELLVFEHPDAADPRDETRSGYAYAEMANTGYLTYRRSFGPLSVQGGLRGERTATRFESRTVGETFERSYTSVFPSVNVAYTVAPGRTARLQYSRRISRPSPFHLDPFVPATDPLNRFVGNPELEPAMTDAVSLDYSWSGRVGTLRVGPYYRRTTDMWERIRTVDSDGVATSRWENGLSATAYGSTVALSLRPAGRISGSTNVNLFRDVRDGTNISGDYRATALRWSLGGNVSGRVTDALAVQVFANHFPAQSILQGRASGYTFTSVTIRQQLFNSRGNVSIGINDPLNLTRFDSSSRDATYVQTSRSSFSSRMVRIGFTVNFGRPPERQSRPAAPEGDQAGEEIRVR
jgi:hypothetical protein